MVHVENDCVGCPQGCIRCGRQYDYYVWECDECGNQFYSEDEVVRINGKDYCDRCYERIFEEEEEE